MPHFGANTPRHPRETLRASPWQGGQCAPRPPRPAQGAMHHGASSPVHPSSGVHSDYVANTPGAGAPTPASDAPVQSSARSARRSRAPVSRAFPPRRAPLLLAAERWRAPLLLAAAVNALLRRAPRPPSPARRGLGRARGRGAWRRAQQRRCPLPQAKERRAQRGCERFASAAHAMRGNAHARGPAFSARGATITEARARARTAVAALLLVWPARRLELAAAKPHVHANAAGTGPERRAE